MKIFSNLFILLCAALFFAGCGCQSSLPTSNEYLARGEGYHKDGDVKKALKAYNKALKINPNNIEVYGSRGAAYFFLGEYQKAADDFGKVIENKPGEVSAYSALGATLAAAGQNQEALPFINYALSLNPNKAEYYLSRGSVYYALEDYENALNDYNIVLQLQPFAGAYLARAAVYEKMGKADLAEADKEKAQDPATSKYLNALIN